MKIYADSQQEPICHTLTKRGKQKYDIQFKDDLSVENKEFQKVILTQEWISYFLMENDGEIRFKKFMEIPELIEINNYYKDVIGLCNHTDNKIQRIRDEIKKIEKEINNSEEIHLLESINDCVRTLVEGGENVSLVKISSTKEDVLRFNNDISKRILDLEGQLEKIRKTISNILLAKEGSPEIDGIDIYSTNILRKEESLIEIKKIKEILTKIERQTQFKNEFDFIMHEIRKHVTQRDIADNVLQKYREYEKIKQTIATKEKIKADEKQNLEKIKLKIIELRKQELETVAKLDALSSRSNESNDLLNKLPNLKINLEYTRGEIVNSEKLLRNLRTDIDVNEGKKRLLEDELEGKQAILSRIKNGIYPSSSNDEFTNYRNIIEKLNNDNNEIEKLKLRISKVERRIEQQETFNSNIEEFVRKGLEIVNDIQTSNCPLCNHPFGSYIELAENISNNKSLNNLLKELLNERTNCQKSLSILTTEKTEGENKLIVILDSAILQLKANLNKYQNESESLVKQYSELEEYNSNKSLEYDNFKNELRGADIQEYESILMTNYANIKSKIYTIANTLDNQKGEIHKLLEQADICKSRIELTQKEVDGLFINEDYTLITKWFKDNYPNIAIELKWISDFKMSCEQRIEDLRSKAYKNEKEFNELNNELAAINSEKMNTKKKELEKNIESYSKRTNSYKSYLLRIINVSAEEYSIDELAEVLSEMYNKYKIDEAKLVDILAKYNLLSKIAANLMPYLYSERKKLELKKMKSELKYAQESLSVNLRKEKDRVKEHLEKRIKDFFYKDLINQIYRKIDPHPEFKSVEFKANFESDNPRLDVFVVNETDKQTIVPNLYFSSAQINILSLSIFLASALNSKGYNCIFIDDPIQSMDSINVLSTIDLLRSIILFEDKQVILSTHDENFHNLLMKKIPPDIFKSRFIEFETFGKLKRKLIEAN